MQNYIWLKHRKKIAIKRNSLLDWVIMHLIPNRIGYYQIVRIGAQTDWAIFNWNGKHNYGC